MRRRDALLAFPALGALAACASLRSPAMNAGALEAELRAVVEDPEAPLASLQVLAIRSGRLAYEGAFGRRHIADKDAPDLPATRDSLYRVASISKLVVTLGVLKLVEAGRLDLDADAGSYLGYALRNPHFPDLPITVRMMTAHTSSIRDDGGYFFDEAIDLREVLVPGGRHYGSGAMYAKTRPGAYFRYTNFTWGIIGTIVEKITGERFDRYMDRAVLRPLGMAGSFDAAAVPVERVATLYRKRKPDDDDGPWDPKGPWIAQVDDYHGAPALPRTGPGYVPGRNGTRYGPQGGLRASASDLGRVMRMLMDGGTLDGVRFLQPSTVEALFARQWTYQGAPSGQTYEDLPSPKMLAWGLGNQQFLDVGGPGQGDRLVERGGFTAVGHLGDAWGLRGAFVFNRDSRDGLVFLSGGPGFDPATRPGKYSSFYRFEERIMTALLS
jgi:CubicO group peptidase (beta-lactamase class C family)